MKYVIVDDNPADRRLLQIHLESITPLSKNEYILLQSVGEFKKWFEDKNICDLIFLDLGLPDSSGVETVEKAVAVIVDIPIIVLTGLNDIAVGEGALRAGAADYLVKDNITTALIEKTVCFAMERIRYRIQLSHHTAFLEALRNIDKKMQIHMHTSKLLDYICRSLMKVGNYDAIWTVRHGESLPKVSYSGNCAFARMHDVPDKALHTCNLAQYLEDHMHDLDILVEKDYHAICSSCPLGLSHGNSGFIALPLYSETEVYGSLVILGKRELIVNHSEQLLFRELAKSISHMLYTREIKQREEEMDQLRNRLHEFERLETLGRIAGGMAHDFNNQLTSILGNSEYLEYELRDKPELLECVREIINSAQISTVLARDVLQFSRSANSDLGECNLLAVITDTTKLIQSTLPKTVSLHVQYDIEESVIQGISNKIENALLNLAINSADAMGQKGKIEISVTTEAILNGDTLCDIFDILPGEYIAIAVKDTGEGIKDELKEKIFSPFFTTKGAEKGTGLGLPSVLSMVREHKGALDFVSESGAGTTFTIYLPKTAERVSSQTDEEEVLLTGSGRILLVDDEASVRKTVTKLIERLGYEVIPFASTDDVFKMLSTASLSFDIVISDYDMPNLNGVEFLERLQYELGSIKAILMTGHNVVSLVEALKNKPIEFRMVQKPFRISHVSQVIAQLLSDSE